MFVLVDDEVHFVGRLILHHQQAQTLKQCKQDMSLPTKQTSSLSHQM
jgi:hypothetical protein